MKKKLSKPKSPVEKPEPTIPENRLREFEDLVDRYMEKHNMSGNAARQKAFTVMGLTEGVLSLGISVMDLTEGFKRAIRRARRGDREAVSKEIGRLGARKGWIDYDVDVSGKYLTRQTEEDLKSTSESHSDKIALLAKELIPVPKSTSILKPRERIELEVQRAALRDIGRRAANKAYASFGAEDVYTDQPVVKAKDEKEKTNWLKMILRMRELGLT